ncbi:MAG: hypothetical protein IANPNBLG_01566 [Bryobacteraceae bacterium]|nr:hypothetical protein [Bryobacteraceae bacterium]
MIHRRTLIQGTAALAAAPLARAQSPKGHLRAGLVAYSYRKPLAAKTMDYETLIRKVSEMGLDGLDTTVYWFPDTSDAYLARLRATAYKNAVSLYSVAVRVRLCQPAPELRRAEVENAKKWVDVAEKVGASHVRVFGGAIPKGVTEAQAISWAAEVLKRAADYSGGKGIFIGVEDDGGLTTTAEPTVEIVKQADNPYAGINLDTGNFPRDGYAQAALCIPYAVSTHVKVHIAAPGGAKEKADWSRIAAMLVKGGYKGYMSLEYENQDDDAGAAIPKFAAELRRVTRSHSV